MQGLYKAVASRITAEGETVQMEISAKTGQELQEKLTIAYRQMDERLHTQNMRIIAAHTRMKELTPEGQQAVKEVYELLHGKRMPRPGELVTQIIQSEPTQQVILEQDA